MVSQTIVSPAGPPAAPAAPESVKFFDAPTAYASSIQVSFIGNDAVVTFSRPKVGIGILDGIPEPVALAEASAIVYMSAGTAKDLMLALQSQIGQFEAMWGPINTEFSKKHVTPA